VLDADAQQLWSEYLRAEQDRIRDVMLPALDRFIAALARLPETSRRDWALQLASDVVDQGADTPVRFPLFERVLLPALTAGVVDERPGCARWLAHFESLLMNSKQVALPDRELVGLNGGFLREAVNALATGRAVVDVADLDSEAEELFQRLRAVRRALADAESVPAYIVFSDAVLLRIATARPSDEASLLAIAGVGPAKLARYGDAILDLLKTS